MTTTAVTTYVAVAILAQIDGRNVRGTTGRIEQSPLAFRSAGSRNARYETSMPPGQTPPGHRCRIRTHLGDGKRIPDSPWSQAHGLHPPEFVPAQAREDQPIGGQAIDWCRGRQPASGTGWRAALPGSIAMTVVWIGSSRLRVRPGRSARAVALRRCSGPSWARSKDGGRLRLIALIEEASVIERILRHRHLPTEIPAPRPGRADRRRRPLRH